MQRPTSAPSPAQLREQADPSERSQPIPLVVAAVTAAPMHRYTENTITEPARLRAELVRIRGHGHHP